MPASILRAAAAAFAWLAAGAAGAQVVSITPGAPQTQTFDMLAASGSSPALPPGWVLAEAGNNANASYAASDGAANAGDTYSYGGSGSTERAYGGLQSGNLNPTLAAVLRNDTGAQLTQLVVAFTGEQWRLGALGRADRLDFQYSLDANAPLDGAATWIAVDALDFAAPVGSGAIGALDGNAAGNRLAIEATIGGLALAPAAILWVRWSDFNASGADDGLAIDNVAFSVAGGGGDVAPTVAGTQPANGAVAVAPGANLVVTFSEPVTPTGAWQAIACASGPRLASVGGGPLAFTLDPDADFAFGDACTVTIVAAQVRDQDGVPDPMVANHVFGFGVAQDTPPGVATTVPAANATNVGLASNLVVAFTEQVAAAAGAFALDCGGPRAFALANVAQSTYTLDPVQDFAPLSACTLSVLAAQVTDLDGAPDPLPADVVVAFTSGQTASGYYATVDASSCVALRASLHALVDDHNVLPYSGASPNTWDMLEAADQDPNASARVLDVYRNRSYDKPARRATGSSPNDGTYYNREHTWPNSLGFGSATGDLGLPNAPYTDGHMLHLSATDWNSDRGNKPYADCPPPGCGARGTDAQAAPFNGGGGSCDHALGNCNWVQSPEGNAGSFEVWRQRKGDAARAMLYMDLRYEGGVASGGNTAGQSEPDLVLTDTRSQITGTSASPAYMGLRSVLLAWQLADPPSAQDLLRNDVIQSYQGNRNPFVDHPEWVPIAFAQPCTATTDALFANGFE